MQEQEPGVGRLDGSRLRPDHGTHLRPLLRRSALGHASLPAGPLGTGDIKTAILPMIAFVTGLVIYLSFWRVYEKKCLEEEAENEAQAA